MRTMNKVPVAVTIGATILARYGVGDTVVERFQNILKPEHLSEGSFLCRSDDETFRAAVGGLMLSYPDGAPERARIEQEMRALARVSLMLQAASMGMGVTDFNHDDHAEPVTPIGLVALWNNRRV